MQIWKLIYFGSPQNSANLLKKLYQDKRFKIKTVITQPDRPDPTPVSDYTQTHSIPVLKPSRDPKEKHLLTQPAKLTQQLDKLSSIDLILSYEFGQLIPQDTLNLGHKGGLNIHFSLLPAYRGPAPLPWQILNNEKHTGITVIKMTEKFDQGEIIYQEVHKISSNDTTQTLHKKLSSQVLKILPNLLAQYLKNSSNLPDIPDIPNLKPQASFYPRLTRQDGYISWQDFVSAVTGRDPKKAKKIEKKIRAYKPWPGIWTTVGNKVSNINPQWIKKNQGKRLKILKAELKNKKLLPTKVQLSGHPQKPWQNYLS